jgi:hypothetical protein
MSSGRWVVAEKGCNREGKIKKSAGEFKYDIFDIFLELL